LSPILVRPVREQLEHDRVIRQLQRELSRRKIEVGINPGAEQNVALGSTRKEYPDVVLFSTEKGRKVLGVVEVETGESVNNLEAMAQWAHYARLRAPFLLYVPMGSVDVARRLAADNDINVAEIHSYHQVGDLIRFTLVHRIGAALQLPDPEPVSATPPTPPPPPPPKKDGVVAAPPQALGRKTEPKKPEQGKAAPPRNGLVKATKDVKEKIVDRREVASKNRPGKNGKAKAAAPVRKAAKPVRGARPARATAKPAPRKAVKKVVAKKVTAKRR
jgi:hypothetical protein